MRPDHVTAIDEEASIFDSDCAGRYRNLDRPRRELGNRADNIDERRCP
jgi:hypothetical protein